MYKYNSQWHLKIVVPVIETGPLLKSRTLLCMQESYVGEVSQHSGLDSAG